MAVGETLESLLDDLEDVHSQLRDLGSQIESAVETMDRYSPSGDGDMDHDDAGEWIHRDDTLHEIRGLLK